VELGYEIDGAFFNYSINCIYFAHTVKEGLLESNWAIIKVAYITIKLVLLFFN
jgi:hypothetical protein